MALPTQRPLGPRHTGSKAGASGGPDQVIEPGPLGGPEQSGPVAKSDIPGNPGPPPDDQRDAAIARNVQTVARLAREMGVDPALGVAVMLKESGGRHWAAGDHGSSIGLFQLHRGGRLTTAVRNGWLENEQQGYDPASNAAVGLRGIARIGNLSPELSPGQIAAAAQRPADPEGYAMRVERLLPKAAQLIAQSNGVLQDG